MTTLSDAELIEQIRQGADWAAATLLRRYQDGIIGYLFMMVRNHQDAEDAAQEAFMEALRSLKHYREQGRFKCWLYRIAQRQGMKILRRRKNRPLNEADLAHEHMHHDWPDDAPGPAASLQDRESIQKLHDAMDCLTDHERQVVMLRIQSEMPFREIARIMACPLNTALARMHTATIKLRQALQGVYA